MAKGSRIIGSMILFLCLVFILNCAATLVVNVQIQLPENSPLSDGTSVLVLPPSSDFEILNSVLEVSFVTVATNKTNYPTSTPVPKAPVSVPPPSLWDQFGYYISGAVALSVVSTLVILMCYLKKRKQPTHAEKPKIAVRINPEKGHQGFIRMSSKGSLVNSRKY